MIQENESVLVGQMYAAAQGALDWGDILGSIGELIGLDCWTLLRVDRASNNDVVVISAGGERLSADAAERYQAHYGAIDPRVSLARSGRAGNVVFCQAHFDDRFVSGNEFYQDFLLPEGLRYCFGASAYRSENADFLVGLMRGPERGKFDDVSQSILQRLLPHLSSSLKLMTVLEEKLMIGQASSTALETCGTAIIVIDRLARIRHANRIAEELLLRGEVIQVRGGKVKLAEDGARQRFDTCLARCMASGKPEMLIFPSCQKRQSRHTMMLVKPHKQSLFSGMLQGDRVICLITPFEPRRVATVEQLMSLFAFTPAEARSAKAIGIGETLEVYANNNGLKVSTVRCQLKSVFAKTATGRQTDLVRLISAIPVMR